MKQIVLALILSISLHLLAIYLLKDKQNNLPKDISTTKIKKKSNVHYVKLKKPQKKVVKKAKPASKPKPIKEKKVTKKKNTKQQEKQYIKAPKIVKKAKRKVIKKKPKKIIKKPVEKIEATPNYQKMNPTKLQKKTLDEFLSTPVLSPDMLDEETQSYIKLYGEEYNNFTKVQKVFLQKNLKGIGRITQKYLRYPKVSIQTHQQGMNIVEFTLYPNGDISRPMISSSSGFTALDDNTIETIKIAYKDYPRPSEPTKIKIYVTYRLY